MTFLKEENPMATDHKCGACCKEESPVPKPTPTPAQSEARLVFSISNVGLVIGAAAGWFTAPKAVDIDVGGLSLEVEGKGDGAQGARHRAREAEHAHQQCELPESRAGSHGRPPGSPGASAHRA